MYWTYLCDISLYLPAFTDWSGSSYMNITRQLKLSRAFLEQRNVSDLRPFSSPLLLPDFPLGSCIPSYCALQACAPLYSWRTEKDTPRSDATGTCYLSVQNFTRFVEYAPCRTGNSQLFVKSVIWSSFLSPCSSQNIITSSSCVLELTDAEGQGYCQGGFSADFTRVITIFLFVHKVLLFFCFHNFISVNF